MGKETKLFKSEERKSRSEVGAYLHQLADMILQGKVALSHGENAFSLQIPQGLILELEVEEEDKREKGRQHSLEVEIKWFEDHRSVEDPVAVG